MTGFVVVEIPRRREPVMPDPFIAALEREQPDDGSDGRRLLETPAENALPSPSETT